MTDYAEARLAMVNSQIRPNDVTDHRIQDAMAELPRELFLPKAERAKAYADTETRLTETRVMMAPMHFAKLAQAADIKPSDVVLDIACGRGYSCAVLCRLAEMVIGLESAEEGLAEKAGTALSDAGLTNAVVVEGDLGAGDAKQGPYDVIFVNGAVSKPPQAWFDQLAENGRLAVVVRDGPVGRARIYTKVKGQIGERSVFDAAVSLLPGFEPEPGFVF